MTDHRARPELTPLSFAQRRLWFLNRLEGPGAAYNIPSAILLSGRLDHEALEAALQDALARHTALRTVFPEAEGQPYQHVIPGARVRLVRQPVEIGEPGNSGPDALTTELTGAARRGFDLSQELPVRAWLFRVSVDEHVLLVVAHRIAADAWSLHTFSRDLAMAYATRCIPVGSPVARGASGIPNNAVGCYANTLVLRTDTSGDPDFRFVPSFKLPL